MSLAGGPARLETGSPAPAGGSGQRQLGNTSAETQSALLRMRVINERTGHGKKGVFTLDHLTSRRMISASTVGCEELTTNRTKNFRREINEPASCAAIGKGVDMSKLRMNSPARLRKRITDQPSLNHS